MTSSKYTIYPTRTFKMELKNILYYIKYKLKEPILAKKIYLTILNIISSLTFMPERFMKLSTKLNKSNNLRRLIVNNYIIIFEVKTNTHQVFILHIFHSSEDYITKL